MDLQVVESNIDLLFSTAPPTTLFQLRLSGVGRCSEWLSEVCADSVFTTEQLSKW